MAQSGVKQKWMTGFNGGVNQSVNPYLIENNESPILLNASLDQYGIWSTMPGSTQKGNTVTTSERGWGLFTYNPSSGDHKLGLITERDLYFLNETTNTFALIDSDIFPATTKVNAVNYRDKLYMGSMDGDTDLKYTDGSTVTSVVPKIGGGIITSHKSRLLVAGNAISPNTVFYTDAYTDTFYSTTGVCATDADINGANTVRLRIDNGAKFEADMVGGFIYNITKGQMATILSWVSSGLGSVPYFTVDRNTASWDNDTVYVLQNRFELDGPCTGMIGYGENVIAWDESKMYQFDPSRLQSSEIASFGCINERTIQVVNGNVIWAAREGVFLYDGVNQPIDITPKIRNMVTGDGIWNLVNKANQSNFASGVIPSEGEYRLSVGTLATKSSALYSGTTSVVLVYSTSRGTWTATQTAEQAVDFTLFINSTGSRELYYTSRSAGAVFQVKDTSATALANSGGTTYTIYYNMATPHYVLSTLNEKTSIRGLLVRYTAVSTVTVQYSKDSQSYASFGTLPAATYPTTFLVLPPADTEAVSHSIKFSGAGAFQLFSVGFEYEATGTTGYASK